MAGIKGLEAGSWKLGAGNEKLKTGSWKLGVGGCEKERHDACS
jgi:hypothetical protein